MTDDKRLDADNTPDDDEDDEDDDDDGDEVTYTRDPKAFRSALDAILSRRDPVALRAFLIEQEQWTEETTTDPETALWLMIAASPAHHPLHVEAETWLRAHGHAAEVDAILGRRGDGTAAGKGQRQGGHGGPPRDQHQSRPGHGRHIPGGTPRPTHGKSPHQQPQQRKPRPPQGS